MTVATHKTRLFTVRLWQAARDGDQAAFEWRGKVQALPAGEAYYFRDWPGLIRHLEAMLEASLEPLPDSETEEGETP